MGGGIALTAARVAKIEQVILIDPEEDSLKRQYSLFQSLLDKDMTKNKLDSREKDVILNRIKLSSKLDVADAEYIIEAVSEDWSVKERLFKALNTQGNRNAIIATNTSSIPITRLASLYTKDESKVVGMHFMNPVPVMKLVEVIRAMQTCDSTYNRCVQLATDMGKTCVLANDTPGFTANRLLAPYLNEAVNVLWEMGWHPTTNNKDSLVKSIDECMKLGTNVPMGPLQLGDFVGLDTLLSIMRILQNGLGAEKFRPSPLLMMMVEAGWHGKKTGRGFYNYQR